MDLINQLASELELSREQVSRTVKLFDEGNTLPFIARYRKEVTGGLDEEELRRLEERLIYLRNLEARKEEVLRSIEEQGKLTPELAKAIKGATIRQEVEDYYLPFRPKRRTRATKAKEQGLEPLADLIFSQEMETGEPEEIATAYLAPGLGVETPEQALAGAMDIIAEYIADQAAWRKIIRDYIWEHALIVSELKKEEKEAQVYQQYHQYSEPVKRIPPHRILALNRGEKEECLKVGLQLEPTPLLQQLEALVLKNKASIFTSYLKATIEDSFNRLIFPSIEREIRTALTEKAEEQAIKVFGLNLRQLLLQAPVRGKTVLGIDPGFRTGCKVVVVDAIGRVQETATIFPHPPQGEWEQAKILLTSLIEKHQVDLVASGNGTAARETEELVAEVLAESKRPVYYTIVSEAGASVYSASKLAREELPDHDVSMRGAVSIARRLQDPLAELVKIEPKALGVGEYQHDVNQSRLGQALKGVVESCVNYVGVDLNTASASLLQNVAGIGPALARSIVDYRETNGPFRRREDLLKVKRLGPHVYTQAAGFLRLPDGEYSLENTGIHPESYHIAETLLTSFGFTSEDLKNPPQLTELRKKLKTLDLAPLAQQLETGLPTLEDIIDGLCRPGRDPREELPGPVFRRDVKAMKDLKPGMILQGVVRNVVDFGAFIDLGVEQDGLAHISQLTTKYIRHPLEVVSVGQKVKARVLSIDLERKRIALSLKEVD
ncbi:MAG TPA: RNA-binding transcriptional accessory protein [Firmicutes bacterium]|nr:RNA-binding transcriptional accessory protein [Bacillota bacterium]